MITALKLKSSYVGFRLPPSSSILRRFSETYFTLSLVILCNQPYLSDFFTDPNFPLLEKSALENCLGLDEFRILSSKKRLVKKHLPPIRNMRFFELQTHFEMHNNVQALPPCLVKSLRMLNILLKIIGDQTSERRKWNNGLWYMSNSEIQYWESPTYEVESLLNNLEFLGRL